MTILVVEIKVMVIAKIQVAEQRKRNQMLNFQFLSLSQVSLEMYLFPLIHICI
jgi:hypothetical protein